MCFIVCSATLLIIRGYVNARDRMMEKEGHTDSDLADYTGVTVPFGSVFPLCLAKSHEKYKRVNKIIIITLYSFTFCRGHECKLFFFLNQASLETLKTTTTRVKSFLLFQATKDYINKYTSRVAFVFSSPLTKHSYNVN